ncbi:hypothetical protein ElyMa_002380500 [Elysia marginata]|uniref:Secreted protein n=1 Tax=Elysia marginata TaxID=1093978 RepID=A0AAV4GD00_9GAST|nr:hypothetical protein ElyMa_002380500 [Elysia marginata]
MVTNMHKAKVMDMDKVTVMVTIIITIITTTTTTMGTESVPAGGLATIRTQRQTAIISKSSRIRWSPHHAEINGAEMEFDVF